MKYTSLYDKRLTRYHYMQTLYEARFRHSLALDSQHNIVYLTGGYDEKDATKTAFAYHTKTNEWLSLPQMVSSHVMHSSCCLNNFIYVFCGECDLQFEEFVEILDINSQDENR